MSITKTKEQIAELVSDGRIYTPTDAELRALADSHTKLLEAAKATITQWNHDDCDGGDCGFEQLHRAIEEAEA